MADLGLVIINEDNPKRPINSGSTNYKLHPLFRTILFADDKKRAPLIGKWREFQPAILKRKIALETKHQIGVSFKSVNLKLSPGKHNTLIKHIIEDFAERFVDDLILVYVGDTKNKLTYKDVAFCKKYNIKFNPHDKLPDVILFSKKQGRFYIVESVTSVGPFEESRVREVKAILEKSIGNKKLLEKKPFFITAFLDKDTFKKFLTVIGWCTAVWIASEPEGIILFSTDFT